MPFSQQHYDLLAALVRSRFSSTGDDSAIAAWKRLMENDGWDDAVGRAEWIAQAERGTRALADAGLYLPQSSSTETSP